MHPWIARRVIYPLWQRRTQGRVLALLSELETTQFDPQEKVRDLQWRRLRALLDHAYRRVPYYRQAFADSGVHPEALGGLDDLARLPILTKETVRDHGTVLRADNVRPPLVVRRTSGSTGVPLTVYANPGARDAWDAAAWRTRRWWGIDIGRRSLRLESPRDRSASTRRKQFWLLNHADAPTVVLDEPALEAISRRLTRLRTEALFGYPSALALLARHVGDRRGRAFGLRAVVTSGESLHDDQRALISRTFGCPVVNEYGASEIGFIAGECPSGRLHIAAENVVVEFAQGEEATGRAVLVTDLTNLAMPLIRYRIGDLAIAGPPCPCGRGLPVMRLLSGREEDFFILADGRRIEVADLIGQAVEHLTARGVSVREFRAIQRTPAHLEILVATAGGPSGTWQGLAEAVEQGLPRPVRVTVTPLGELPRDATGKLRRVIGLGDAAVMREPVGSAPPDAAGPG